MIEEIVAFETSKWSSYFSFQSVHSYIPVSLYILSGISICCPSLLS